MRWTDTLELAATSLRQRPWRTGLTVLGIVLGTMLLFVAGAGRCGVQAAIERQFRSHAEMRTILVSAPDRRGTTYRDLPLDQQPELPGTMSDERRRRLLKSLGRWRSGAADATFDAEPPPVRLTSLDLETWQALPGVVAIEPLVVFQVEARHADVVRLRRAFVLPAAAELLPDYLVAGRLPQPEAVDEVLINEAQVYEWGYHDEAHVPQAVGQLVELTYYPLLDRNRAQAVLFRILAEVNDLTAIETKALQQARAAARDIGGLVDLPEQLLHTIEPILDRHPELRPADRTPLALARFRVVGVFRPIERALKGITNRGSYPSASSAGLVMSPAASRQFLGSHLGDSVPILGARLTVESEANLRSVVDALQSTGLNVDSMLELVEKIRSRVELISAALTTLAAAAVVLATLGIAKTVAASIVERTREIAVMKAIGAEDRQVQRLFVVEGALLGTVGGGVGLLLGWIAALRLDAWARSSLERRLRQPVTDQVFLAPGWLWIGVPLLVIAIAILAGLLPSRRATRIDPAMALRHE